MAPQLVPVSATNLAWVAAWWTLLTAAAAEAAAATDITVLLQLQHLLAYLAYTDPATGPLEPGAVAATPTGPPVPGNATMNGIMSGRRQAAVANDASSSRGRKGRLS